MLLLGIDIGTSSVKVSVVDAHSGHCIGSAQYPETEAGILSLHPGWAEQSPQQWWEHVQLAIAKLHAQDLYNSFDISAIGIAYQMHGLVMIDEAGEPVRDSIIWCDSRAVETGDRAFDAIGRENAFINCLIHRGILPPVNSPG